MLLAVLVGVPLGIRAATGGRWTRTLTEGFVVFGISVPDFWLGIMLVLIFSATLAILPPSGYVPFAKDPIGNLRYMALPVLTLAAGEAAYILRTTRGAIASVMDRPFVTFLRAKGISQNRIVFGHALRNAGPSIVTVIGIQVGVLLGGAIIIETMFALPGRRPADRHRHQPAQLSGGAGRHPRHRDHLHRRLAGDRPHRRLARSARRRRRRAMTEATDAPRSLPRRYRRGAPRVRLMLLGGGVLIALALIAIAAPLIAPYDPETIDACPRARRRPTSPTASARTRWAATC